ncbi:MAG: N-acetyl-gamma-glutamyl-phosphate reductase [Steroidobacteraceae bacterium]
MSTPAFVLGGTGYVAGELLRLIASHPKFELAAVMSDSQPGERVAAAFPHLLSTLGEQRFVSEAELIGQLSQTPTSAVFGAAPHGVSAALIDRLLDAATAAGVSARVVDISADFRYASAPAYAAVYAHEHGAPQRLREFTCALPEHLAMAPTPHIAHPGCFATATLLASVPLLAFDLIEPTLFVSGITGSTGSGRKPVEGTHHPLRHSDLYSYNALAHRHAPEITACAAAASGVQAHFAFVPHSGPFARGIHVTVQAKLKAGVTLDQSSLLTRLRDYYANAPFVRISETAPRIKDVVASNYAHLSATSRGGTIAVMAVIDNLTKGAAGGGMQWMNRLFGWPETLGLTAPAAGWT